MHHWNLETFSLFQLQREKCGPKCGMLSRFPSHTQFPIRNAIEAKSYEFKMMSIGQNLIVLKWWSTFSHLVMRPTHVRDLERSHSCVARFASDERNHIPTKRSWLIGWWMQPSFLIMASKESVLGRVRKRDPWQTIVHRNGIPTSSHREIVDCFELLAASGDPLYTYQNGRHGFSVLIVRKRYNY